MVEKSSTVPMFSDEEGNGKKPEEPHTVASFLRKFSMSASPSREVSHSPPPAKFSLPESEPHAGGLGLKFRKMSRKFSMAMTHDHDHELQHVEHDILLEPLFTGQAIYMGEYPDSPINHVKELVEDYQSATEVHPIFCEMMELISEDEANISKSQLNLDNADRPASPWIWTERARWVKYEETVEEGGTRFSKPHITLLTIQSLLQLRNCLKRGASLFDVQVNSFKELVDLIVRNWMQRHDLANYESENIENVLLAPKQHMIRSTLRQASGESPETARRENRPASRDLDDLIIEDDEDKTVSMSTSPSKAKIDQSLMRKIQPESEAAVIFVGHLKELTQPITEFVRLGTAQNFHPKIPELPLPTRFVFILLIPHDHYQNEATIIGRCMGSLMVDEIFAHVAYGARDAHGLVEGVDEFLSQTVIVPPAKWNPICRFEPQDDMPPVGRTVGKIVTNLEDLLLPGTSLGVHSGLRRTGKLFGGFVQDIKRKIEWYPSDFLDAFRGRFTQSLAAAIFLFFANVTKIITFGGVMGHMLDNNMAAVENLLSGGICGVIYALFSGQPLCVLSATGPTLVFEAILYDFCQQQGWAYLPMRCWVGFWTAAIIMILVMFDASAIVAMITRFTEEAFATLISVIFIIQAFEELWELIHEAPVSLNPQQILTDPCMCNTSSIGMYQIGSGTNFTLDQCTSLNGTYSGRQCNFLPDVFMFSIIIFFGTFTVAIALKFFRTSGFLPSKFRQSIADFNVFIAIVSMTALNYLVGLDVQGLRVPSEFHPTLDRGWLVDPFSVDYWWIPLVAALPAIFFTILVVMDQQITSVIINRPDNKLLKGYGYHLDLFVVCLLMILCALMGIPFYVAATVISIMHVDSLRLMSECAAPGEKPTFLGVREQRVTALLAHILIGLTVVLTPVIKLVPMPVLLGVFLYMGVVSLIGQQFVQRITILFMPMKHQPDYSWLRVVRLKRVHMFTAIQIVSVVLLFVVKYTKSISMVFPIMLVIMVLLRIIMDKIFTAKELAALDDPLPSFRNLIKPATKIKCLFENGDREAEAPEVKRDSSHKLVKFAQDSFDSEVEPMTVSMQT